MSGQLHILVIQSPGKSPRYPLDGRLVGTQSRSGRGGEEKNNPSLSLPLPIIKPRSSSQCPGLPRKE